MRIAQIAPIIETVPPQKYGGTERVISELTEGLVERGHDVTLFATADSQTQAKLDFTYPTALRQALPNDTRQKIVLSFLHLHHAYLQAEEFDIIHDHTSTFGITFAQACTKPVIMTLHGAFTNQNKAVYSTFRKPYLVTISHKQAELAPPMNHLGTVYNGLSLENAPFARKPKKYLLFVGRICPEKGVHHAITVAQKLDLPLIIAAKLERNRYGKYFDTKIKPHLNEKIKWIGEVSSEERNRLCANALCFLHPVTWPEPFGLTLIEAMACGCPVVAMNKGAIPEVVNDEQTGFVVHSVEEMIAAVKKIDTIDRAQCRSHVLTTFGRERMVNNYEALYQAVLHTTAPAHSGLSRLYHGLQFAGQSTQLSPFNSYRLG